MEMQPYCITPTGLKSPTNNSHAPDDRTTWKSASISDSKMDYRLMRLGGDPENSTNVQLRQASEITSGFLHGIDGSCLSVKRSHIGELDNDNEEEEGARKRRK
jgi:hypothetical protein